MAMAISIECGVRCDEHRAREKRRKNAHRVRGRLAAFALAAAALALMAYGQQWLLQQAPAAASELAMATYAVEAIYGATSDANVNGAEANGKDIAR